MAKPKCSIIVDGELPPGLVANTVGVIAMALGKLAPLLTSWESVPTLLFPVRR